MRKKPAIAVEAILHHPETALPQIAKRILNEERKAGRLKDETKENLSFHGLMAVRSAVNLAMESFKFYPGVPTLLERAHDAGVLSGIYTNTGPLNTFKRLRAAGVNADHLDVVYTRARKDGDAAMIWREKLTDPYDIELASKFRPYTTVKPNAQPLIDYARERGIRPNEVLFVGEGESDWLSVPHPKTGKPVCYFAVQKDGQRMPDRQVEMNQELRDGHPLGHAHFEAAHPEIHQQPGVIILDGGFDTLLNLIDQGFIQLESHDAARHRLAANEHPSRAAPIPSPAKPLAPRALN